MRFVALIKAVPNSFADAIDSLPNSRHLLWIRAANRMFKDQGFLKSISIQLLNKPAVLDLFEN